MVALNVFVEEKIKRKTCCTILKQNIRMKADWEENWPKGVVIIHEYIWSIVVTFNLHDDLLAFNFLF